VTEDAAAFHVQFDSLSWVAIPSENGIVAQVIGSLPAVVSWSLLPDDGANLGRALRCRMMSLLC
jgi:hypothetical protein